jgi:uncharacterized protein YmfQ (DUF2313 family)
MYNDEDFDHDESEGHEPGSEPIPPPQQYMSAFHQAETKTLETVQKVSQHVADEPDQESEALYMYERLVAIEKPAYTLPQTNNLWQFRYRQINHDQRHPGSSYSLPNGKCLNSSHLLIKR